MSIKISKRFLEHIKRSYKPGKCFLCKNPALESGGCEFHRRSFKDEFGETLLKELNKNLEDSITLHLFNF